MPPPSETSPRLTKLIVKAACSDATMKSQASAMSQPSPAAAPLTAAITGFGMPCSKATLLCVWPCRRQPLNATCPAGAFSRSFMPAMSPPEQNALPLPVSTTARTASSSATRSEHGDELGAQRVVDRVAHLGPVERDDRDLVLDRQFDERCHRTLPAHSILMPASLTTLRQRASSP